MSEESQNQSIKNLQHALLRCEQEKLEIWQVAKELTEALRPWAESQNLDVKVTLLTK